MTKQACIIIFLILICMLPAQAFAGSRPSEEQIVKTYQELGYTSMQEAVQRFEAATDIQVKLPRKLPAFSFTHRFGKLGDHRFLLLDLSYINAKNPYEHFKIDVRRADGKIRFIPGIDKTYKLKDGATAAYRTGPSFTYAMFVFERGGLEYHLAIDKKCGKRITAQLFMTIADSME